jgi:hypothetical protein
VRLDRRRTLDPLSFQRVATEAVRHRRTISSLQGELRSHPPESTRRIQCAISCYRGVYAATVIRWPAETDRWPAAAPSVVRGCREWISALIDSTHGFADASDIWPVQAMTFKVERHGSICMWTGDPDCEAGFGLLRSHLANAVHARLEPGQTLTTAQIGNLGEALAFLVGRGGPHPAPDHRALADNCHNPLAGNSKSGLDILWIAFDANDAAKDHAWIQEVKTTLSSTSASYIAALKDDYSKLFSLNFGLSLDDRLGDAGFRLEHIAQAPELAKRARALGARSAQQVSRVTLEPTGVHDRRLDALTIMEDVRLTLTKTLEWPASLVEPHLIALADIATRLADLVR